MKNIANVKAGIVAVSRNCFPIELSEQRRKKVVAACRRKQIPLIEIESIIESENDINRVMDEIKNKGVNALVLYLGNFGPEGPTSILAQKFEGPVMLCGAAEETQDNLFNGRGDAYCGMLSAVYNMGLRKVTTHIPEYPIGMPSELAGMIEEFIPVARVILGLKNLKIFSFGPRPHDFFTCESPIRPILGLGVEIMENSELDLYDIFLKAKDDPLTKSIKKEIKEEIGSNIAPALLDKLAQYEAALTKFYGDNLGASAYGIFANKCWPAFEPYFGFAPCYINSRLATKGITVACEADIYGAISEYIAMAATESPATILDINNTVPSDLIKEAGKKVGNYKSTDLFMAFHCGNTSSSCLKTFRLQHHLIMHRLLEGDKPPTITYGTLEGQIKPGDITLVRVQPNNDTEIKAFVSEGESLDLAHHSFGATGVFAIREMGRFYRHILLGKGFTHHVAVAFGPAGKTIFSVLKMLGVKDVYSNLPKGVYYPGENPFI